MELRRQLQTGYSALPAPQDPAKAKAIYTDGSGSQGRCSADTPAGWGFVVVDKQTGEREHSANGPVETDSRAIHYIGANVGSNNTAELSAIVEALLFQLASPTIPASITFYYDSKWAANAVRGTHRPKRHKEMVSTARRLHFILAERTEIHWEWIKGHTGNHYNEMADKLAGEAKNDGEHNGGRQSQPRMTTPQEHQIDNEGTETADTQYKYKQFKQALLTAEQKTLPQVRYRASKPWIKEDLARKIHQAKRLKATGDASHVQYYRALKSEARKQKRTWTREQLMEDTNLSHMAFWNRIRRLKTGFRERRQRLKHNGKLVPWSQMHSTFTQRLKNVQWSASQVTPEELDLLRESPPINPTDPEPIRAITMAELHGALRKLKRNKAPGLDGVKQDVLRLLDYYAETKLLQLLNECLTSGKIPKEWKQARIVCIYKNKGSPSLPENYRPISLLNTLYKLYASILQARLAERHDKHLRNTQYGFRAERSTTDPMFIMRRAQDYSAKTGHPLYLLFLDWKMAFDKVDHSAMLIALERFGVHPAYVNIIRDMYDHPEFCTSAPDGSLSWGEAQTGIRQGCPLSPYLFIMGMSVVFSDIDKNLMAKGIPTNTWSTGKPVYDLEYADDTLIMALTPSQLQDLLSAVQVEATLYNMFLNSTKSKYWPIRDIPFHRPHLQMETLFQLLRKLNTWELKLHGITPLR